MDTSTVENNGSPAKVSQDYLKELKQGVKDIATAAQKGTWGSRQTNENERYCRWAGQSDDGRKHADALDGKPPFPFEGASDGRIRLADQLINEREMICVAAATRAAASVTGMEIEDDAKAARIQTLVKWVTLNKLGRAWRRELRKVAQWMHGDSPAVAFMGVFWRQEWAIHTRKVGLFELADELGKAFGDQLPADMIAQVADLVTDEARAAEATQFFSELIPEADPKQIKAMIEAWRAGEVAEFPEPYLRHSAPEVRALRLYDDIFLPANTRELARARVIYLREWLTRAEVMERSAREHWPKTFSAALLGEGDNKGKESASAFPETFTVYSHDGDQVVALQTADDRKGLYEILTAYWRATRPDGAMGVYTVTFHADIEVAATDRTLMEYDHGEYPVVEFARETLTNRLMDTRSVTELVGTEQTALKQLHDSYQDHTAIATVPPLFTPQWAGDDQVIIAPLAQISRRRRDDYEFMTPPAYPSTNDGARKEIRRRVDEYWGRWNAEVSPELVQLHLQNAVDTFLSGTADVLVQVIQLCQQYMTDEEIARVTGGSGAPMIRTVQEIQGKFDLVLDFDVRNLDREYILKLAETLSKYVLPMDTVQTIARDRLVAMIFSAINPNLAERTLRPVEEADRNETNDEETNFAKISAGIEPPMMENGQNFSLRLDVIKGILQKNPGALDKLDGVSQEILKKRIEHLTFMVSQDQNRMIGRLGAKPALEGGEA